QEDRAGILAEAVLGRDPERRSIAGIDDADAAPRSLRIEPLERRFGGLRGIAFAMDFWRQHPAHFGNAADRARDRAMEIGKADIADKAPRRFFLDRPIAIAEERPQPAIAQEPGPAFIWPHRLAAD